MERATATHFWVERPRVFSCFCTKPQGNIGGTHSPEPLVEKNAAETVVFGMFLSNRCSTCVLWQFIETWICEASDRHSAHLPTRVLHFLGACPFRWLKDLVCVCVIYFDDDFEPGPEDSDDQFEPGPEPDDEDAEICKPHETTRRWGGEGNK